MLRQELLSEEMVRAYLEGRKAHVCRPIKPQPASGVRLSPFAVSGIEDGHGRELRPRHCTGDYIYCRETWTKIQGAYFYKADIPPEILGLMDAEDAKWRPSIHMPKEAARLFFRVAKVAAMRLDAVTEEFALEDGFEDLSTVFEEDKDYTALSHFKAFWLATYGPDAHWIWVYHTEPCSKEEAMMGKRL